MSGTAATLDEVLEESRRVGFLGPGPVAVHREHARALAGLVEAPAAFVDLGAGGGVPGLVLALHWPRAAALLVEANGRRCDFLREATARLGLEGRVEVCAERAEIAAREPARRGRYPLVVARSFGRPAVTAECAIGFLAPGGRLVVAEPPGAAAEERWPPKALADLGYSPASVRRTPRASFAILLARGEASPRWPRRVGVPAKRPLW